MITDLGVLLDGTGGVGAYDDLADGTFYGSVDVTSADNGAFVVVELNSDAIAALNSAGGLFAFGGTITTLSDPDVDEFVFAGSHLMPDVRLVVTFVPAPGTIALLATFGLGGVCRRRREGVLDDVFRCRPRSRAQASCRSRLSWA